MKKNIYLFLLVSSIGFSQQVTISPALFNVTDAITITVSFASSTCNSMTTNPVKVYMHSGIGTDANAWNISTIGNWGLDDGVGLMTNNGNGTWSKTITPNIYFGITAGQQSSVTKMGMVFRNATGTQTLKQAPSCVDFLFNVGYFQTTLVTPSVSSSTLIASGGSISVSATNTNGNADYNLLANGTSINTFTGTSYSYTDSNILENKNYDLQITQGVSTLSKKFSVIVTPNTISEVMPLGLEDGINYNSIDATKATLVLDAPGKDFIYVAGSFNNWQPGASYAMKKDVSSTKFWLELTGLVSGTNYTYQYWVVDQTPTAGSPTLVKTADPYSTLVLNKEEDPGIPVGNYPNLPAYPLGQDREVTVLQTGQTPYVWSTATTNFVKPEKDNLVVYEVLVRDFDANRSYQNLIDRIDYFKNLKINAIELMPIMEFEGNESWGYNTSFHMALDKEYGPSAKLKELIDLFHQNGIAVILDVALNHAFGRNPMDRMWMNDPDGDGWGGPASDNPYFNAVAMHSYNVGNDFNHQQARTQYYVKRVIKQWIEEYKIDGFRWDLTKGFTQNCPSTVPGGQDACTGNFQQDRVDVLKMYADYSWGLDPTHYAIFEHLGGDFEEKQWADYRIGESPSKGIMLWGKMTDVYNQLTMGYNTGNDISRMNSSSRGFIGKRLMGYAESHDEERLMYKNLQYGANLNGYNVKTLSTALNRMSALGAVTLLVPGPKMIWHFGELGWDSSIYTCNNGTINDNSTTLPGDCKLDTKPQPQWVNNWLGNTDRNKIYTDWAKMISLKINEPVFLGTATMASVTTLTPNIKITNGALLSSQLKDVLILANFGLSSQNVATGFPYIGTWYNLMDNTSINVTDANATMSIPAGEYRIYGNKTAALAIASFEKEREIYLYPNPASNYFTLNTTTSKVEIYSITGQLVKSFNTIRSKENQFSISDLNQGIYIVKILGENSELKVMRLLKQ